MSRVPLLILLTLFVTAYSTLFLKPEDELTALGPGGREVLVPGGFNWSPAVQLVPCRPARELHIEQRVCWREGRECQGGF